MFVNVAALITMLLGKTSFEVAMGVWGGANGLYAISRGIAKSGVAPKEAPEQVVTESR